MANSSWTAYVPDQSRSFGPFPGSLTPEEVRQALVATGHTSVQGAEMVIDGSVIKFRRVQGGSKGL